MSRSASELRVALVATLLGTSVAAAPGWAQTTGQPAAKRIVSSDIEMNSRQARLRLEFDDGSVAEFAIHDRSAWFNSTPLGEANVGGLLDDPWRELLERAAETPTGQLGSLLIRWSPPANHEAGARLDRAIEDVLAGVTAEVTAAPRTDEAQISDSITRLVDRIESLEQRLSDREVTRTVVIPSPRARAADTVPGWARPFARFWRGFVGLISVLLAGALVCSIGVVAIFFGGRPFIEGVGDTARAATTRSLLVGVAASFLVIPAFVVGCLALAISIIGIPALLLWIPLFPVVVGITGMLGILGVSHAAGEALAQRRFYGADWFRRGNSYYFLTTGMALLLVPFVAAQLMGMLGIGFLQAALIAVGVIVSWAAASIGLGAVLVSRAGTQPLRPSPVGEPEMYAEETHA
jgi:hypothetical protein